MGLTRLRGVGLLALATVAAVGCRGEDLEIDCDIFSAQYEDTADIRGELLPAIGAAGPYPAGIIITEAGVNRLLEAKLSDAIPISDSFGSESVTVTPLSTPLIDFFSSESCFQCVTISFDYAVEVDLGVDTGFPLDPATSGTGFLQMSMPIRLEETMPGKTGVIARYDRANVDQLDILVFGFGPDELPNISSALAQIMTEEIQASFEPQLLMEIDSWEIGQNQVKLAARELFLFPELDTLVLGLQTNLALPEDAALDLDSEPPMGLPMSIQFSTGLLEGMSQRLLKEGEIPDVYNEAGDPDPEGEFAVTIEDLRGTNVSTMDRLTTELRVWRVDGDFCGFAVVEMPLFTSVETDRVGIRAGEIEILSGEGIGAVAVEEEELIRDNEEIVDTFKGALTDQLGLTVNLDALSPEGSNVTFQTKSVTVDEVKLSTNLDFIVFPEE